MRAYCPRFLAKAVETPIITKIEMVTDGSTVYIHVNPIFQKPRQRTTTLATREIKFMYFASLLRCLRVQ